MGDEVGEGQEDLEDVERGSGGVSGVVDAEECQEGLEDKVDKDEGCSIPICRVLKGEEICESTGTDRQGSAGSGVET